MEVPLILASILQGVVGNILSLAPHRSKSIGSAIAHISIDEVMYFIL